MFVFGARARKFEQCRVPSRRRFFASAGFQPHLQPPPQEYGSYSRECLFATDQQALANTRLPVAHTSPRACSTLERRADQNNDNKPCRSRRRLDQFGQSVIGADGGELGAIDPTGLASLVFLFVAPDMHEGRLVGAPRDGSRLHQTGSDANLQTIAQFRLDVLSDLRQP